MTDNSMYLCETESIDYNNPIIREKVESLKKQSDTTLDYIKNAYRFVRDEISHSLDADVTIVSRTASDVLKNGTGICWVKSCLLAALLRANGIPAGICYQQLTRVSDDVVYGYVLHALNYVFVEELGRWIRLDARGNREDVHAEFSLDEEKLAFPVRTKLGEIDYQVNHPDLDERLVKKLKEAENLQDITYDLDEI